MSASDRHASEQLWVCDLGVVPYRQAAAMQRRVRGRRLLGELPDVLLLLEHPPVYTRGRRSRAHELALGEDFYRSRQIEVVDSDRGGRVTYHGPGQLVGYPIMRVDDVGAHLRTMEAAIVRALADAGIAARSRHREGPDYTGVWVQQRKIASIGVHISRGISTHGFAVNLDVDLEPFSWVIACGLPDVTMTSLERELPPGREIDADGFRASMTSCFCAAHRRPARHVAAAELGLAAAPRPAAQLRRRAPRAHTAAAPGARV
jgi:lipoyl(octanoyl) transferase